MIFVFSHWEKFIRILVKSQQNPLYKYYTKDSEGFHQNSCEKFSRMRKKQKNEKIQSFNFLSYP